MDHILGRWDYSQEDQSEGSYRNWGKRCRYRKGGDGATRDRTTHQPADLASDWMLEDEQVCKDSSDLGTWADGNTVHRRVGNRREGGFCIGWGQVEKVHQELPS